MTGEDDGSDPNFQNCKVFTQDGYAGHCLYWNDGELLVEASRLQLTIGSAQMAPLLLRRSPSETAAATLIWIKPDLLSTETITAMT